MNRTLICLRINRKMRQYKIVVLSCLLSMILTAFVLILTSCSAASPPAATPPEQTKEPVAVSTPAPEPEPKETPMPYTIVTPTPPLVLPYGYPGAYVDPAKNTVSLSREIFDLTNQIRAQNGLGKLAYADDLQDAADTRAYECSISFSHTRPDGSSCHSVVEDMDYYVTGENLAMADRPIALAEIIMSKWMTSKGHRANILLPEFTKLAVGVYEKNDVVYATQIFMG